MGDTWVRVELDDERAVAPRRMLDGDVGYDLCSVETCVVPACGRALVDTGIKIEVRTPPGLAALGLVCHPEIKGRSGLATKFQIDVAAGQIDLGYRGRVRVCLVNHGGADFVVQPGDRIAQLKFSVVALPEIGVGAVAASERGARGFGSTGSN
jgi:dUTP pyrophosphatase